MFNLSLTACSFHLRKTKSKKNTRIYDLNLPLDLQDKNENFRHFSDLTEIFIEFFRIHKELVKDSVKQQSFRCEYDNKNHVETESFRMIYTKIYSGVYGSSSDIIDGNTEEVKFQKKTSDIDTKPFYLMVIFPKDNDRVVVQKGLLLFQNVGQFGVKTITTNLMQDFFSSEFRITLKCNTISPDLFIRKVIKQENIKKLVMVKNIKSRDMADNVFPGYGSEIREISKLYFKQAIWNQLMDKIRFVAGGRYNLFEFENNTYDTLKVQVDIGGRPRMIDLHNLENLSIIERIPDEIRMPDGHPALPLLIEHMKKVSAEYLEEMTLHIS